ncbi:hypothetical protein CF336_g3364 [Tilletia laevis]|nr:hypothetical protein CF336_g3364 [Tilletia laevis]KAE8204887.1 hypothetical protein CF335_g2496 [Tilletia laevis]
MTRSRSPSPTWSSPPSPADRHNDDFFQRRAPPPHSHQHPPAHNGWAHTTHHQQHHQQQRTWGAQSHSQDRYSLSPAQLHSAIHHARAVHINGLSTHTLPHHLAHIFSPYGHVAGIDIPQNQNRGGTATVVFGSTREASKAVSHLHTGLIDGQPVQLRIVQ